MKFLFLPIVLLVGISVSAQVKLDAAYLKYITVNQADSSITVAWYASPDDVTEIVVNSVEPKGVTIESEALQSFNGNTDGEMTFKIEDFNTVFGADAYNKPVSLMTTVYNSAGNNSDKLSYYHSSMFAKTSYLDCDDGFTIEWTPYEGKGITLEQYELYQIKSDEDLFISKTFNFDKLKMNVNFFTQQEVCYYIKAVYTDFYGNKQSANSNKTCIELPEWPSPEYINPDYITALDDGNLKMSFTVPGEYWIYDLVKFANTEFDWDISSVMENNDGLTERLRSGEITTGNLTYTTSDTEAATNRNNYLLYVYQGCDKSKDSNFIYTVENAAYLSNIVLEQVSGEYGKCDLKWNSLEKWVGGVYEYNIYRSISGSEFELIESLPAGTSFYNSYSDDIRPYSKTAGEICYYVEAVEGENGNVLEPGMSKSNTVCITNEARVFVPNTLVPNSNNWVNRKVKPVMSFVSADEYQFSVFDQWGNLMFDTQDVKESWDGKIDGKYLNQACYTYYLKYKPVGEDVIEQRGIINIIFVE